MAYKNTDYSTSMRGDVTPIKSVMYRTENNIATPYFMRKVEQSGPDYSEPFYVEDNSGSENTVTFKRSRNSAPAPIIETSTDNKTWTTLGSTSTDGISTIIPANRKLYVRSGASYWGNNYGSNIINCSGDYNVGGNIMSLIRGSNFDGKETTISQYSKYTFYLLFNGSTTLISAEDLLLPATTLSAYCYKWLFKDCSNLVKGPKELPAESMSDASYEGMFSGCSSLLKSPEIFYNVSWSGTQNYPSFREMFKGCSSLNYIKVHFSVWGHYNASISRQVQDTFDWTRLGVNTTGTFVCPSGLTQYFNANGNNTSGDYSAQWAGYCNAIPYGWTVETF